MNVYEKLQAARCELQGMSLKKSGQNKFAGYSYYELGDFLPQIQELCKRKRLMPVVSFGADLASMTVYDIDKPEDFVIFTSPMGSANLKGCHEVQNIGAVETYQRRYLYQVAFEIVEHDALDSTLDPKPAAAPDKPAGRDPKKIAAEIKQAISTLINEPAIAEGFTADAKAAWEHKDVQELENILRRVRKYEQDAYEGKAVSDEEVF